MIPKPPSEAPKKYEKIVGSYCFMLLVYLCPMTWVVPPPRMPVANEGLGVGVFCDGNTGF